jgi:HD-like signal output (HDOD) protein
MKNSSADLTHLIAGAQLPALPQCAVRLLELSQNPDNGPAEFASPIETDPGLTGQVLRFVNSSYFGFAREVSSVKLALTLVGVRTIKNFVLWSAVYSLMPNPRCGGLNLNCLWIDSLRRGLLARFLAKQMHLDDAEEVFSAALLQDMAVPLLARELTAQYRQLFEAREDGRRRLSELERSSFGWSHAEAAATMAQRWSLPTGMTELIARHNDTRALLTGSLDGAAACVACSALLGSSHDARWWERETFVLAYQLMLGDRAPPLAEVFAAIDREFSDFSGFLKFPADTPPLVELLNAPELTTAES